ncbi:hypothetical protein BCR44DRAFT_1445843 [Catenaria anguillulae PL171]|uniref:Uncharacterized protein n=1 Tax=Catenaria anguillulae PL171 TaxID=765915 RepID=A0A1Y2H6J4_9FUNG|nr:hypothetical protein BCR44DRAFT_1445843 [Catenaria anguillulae PL171]
MPRCPRSSSPLFIAPLLRPLHSLKHSIQLGDTGTLSRAPFIPQPAHFTALHTVLLLLQSPRFRCEHDISLAARSHPLYWHSVAPCWTQRAFNPRRFQLFSIERRARVVCVCCGSI